MRRTPLKKVSTKHANRLREYSGIRRRMLSTNQKCECAGCENLAVEIHHKDGRGVNTANEATLMRVCHRCHAEIHSNPNQARKKGYLK